MKAIWSYWSKPLLAQRSFWKSEWYHLLSWVLSVQTASRHFPQTALYTDDAGKETLVDELGLEFGEVSTCLNDLRSHDPEWWCLGKIVAYARQEAPFVHIDGDVFLWEPLPARLIAADVLAQNAEVFPVAGSYYCPEDFQAAVWRVGGWSPLELASYLPRAGMHRAFCCGIFGGCRTDFIRHYAEAALRLVEEPANQAVWPLMPARGLVNLLFEQYLLAACLHYHQRRADSPYAGIRMECLFRDLGDAFRRADEAGFTHLLGSATKQNPALLAQLEQRVQAEYPLHYARCVRWAERTGELAAS